MKTAKDNLNIHQSAWNELCSKTSSPAENKKKISQRRLNLLALLDKYYIYTDELPDLQTKWFDRPGTEYEKGRENELVIWLRIAKRIMHTNKNKLPCKSISSTSPRMFTTGYTNLQFPIKSFKQK